MAGFKKVACLYRVSSKMQLTENDIPMQRNACKEFINSKPFWKFDREYLERGVSGYHKTEAQRDILQQMKQEADKKEFDILLVFMFDRLGRREDETPFIVEWLVGKGVEVWSVKEGQQKFDSRTDKLLNYIRYWQSGGESEKTSMRVYEAQKQMALEGKYRGGCAPYGYDLVFTEGYNKKGYRKKKFVINEAEAETVKMIYKLSCEGLGRTKITKYLNENNIPTRKAKKWIRGLVELILDNPMYTGYYVFGKLKVVGDSRVKLKPEEWIYSKDKIPELIIIDEEQWHKEKELRSDRNIKGRDFLVVTEKILLEDMVKCGHCGGNITRSSSRRRYTRKDNGNITTTIVHNYICNGKRYRDCTGQGNFSAIITEKIVLSEVYNYLNDINISAINKKLTKAKNKLTRQFNDLLSAATKEIETAETQLNMLNNEVVKCLMGESKFTSEQLSRLTEQKENELNDLLYKKNEIEFDQNEQLMKFAEFEHLQKIIPTWKAEFEKAALEEQRVLIAKLIDVIYLSRGKVEIHFKLNIYNIESLYGSKI